MQHTMDDPETNRWLNDVIRVRQYDPLLSLLEEESLFVYVRHASAVLFSTVISKHHEDSLINFEQSFDYS